MGTMLRKTQLVDRCSCHIISWKICTTMRVEDVTDTLDLALKAFGCDLVHIVHKPSLLSDDGSSYAFRDFDLWQWDKSMKHSRGSPYHPQTQKKAMVLNPEEPDPIGKSIPARRSRSPNQSHRLSPRSSAIPQEPPENITPAGVYFGRCKAILQQGEMNG